MLIESFSYSFILIQNRGNNPTGKFMFVEYSWNIPKIYSRDIRKRFPMKSWAIFRIMFREYWIWEYSLIVPRIFWECDMHFFRWIKKYNSSFRSSHPEVFLRKVVLKISSKFTGEHPYQRLISKSNFIEITLRHGCSPVNLLHIFRKPFSRNTSEWLLL